MAPMTQAQQTSHAANNLTISAVAPIICASNSVPVVFADTGAVNAHVSVSVFGEFLCDHAHLFLDVLATDRAKIVGVDSDIKTHPE